MTITSRVTLKSVMEDGDILEGDNLANLIDSYLHLTDTSAQTVTSPVTFTGSATFGNINASDIDVSSLNASVINLGSINTSGLKATIVSATGGIFGASVNVPTVNCNSVNAGDLSCSAISVSGIGAANISCGHLVVSALSAHSIFNLSGTAVFNVTTTAAASAGGAGAVPNAEGYMIWTINGRELLVPYFEKG